MASSSTLYKDIEDQYASITLEGEDNSDFAFDFVEEGEQPIDEKWCIVGRFLTERAIDFDVMRHMMASLFQPGKGMYVKELKPNRYLFQFYHEIDLERVIEGSPWTFNRIQFVFERLHYGQDPRSLTINHLDIWVQVHGLMPGFKSDHVLRELGNYIGTFVKTDPKNFQGIWRDYLQVRVTLDISVPLKRPRNHLIGAKWLRTGVEDELQSRDTAGFDAVNLPISQTASQNEINLARNQGQGFKLSTDILGNKFGGANRGKNISKDTPLPNREINMENNESDIGENSELTILEIKRRRTAELMSGDPRVMSSSPNGPNVLSAQSKMDVQDVSGNANGASKNEFFVGVRGPDGGIARYGDSMMSIQNDEASSNHHSREVKKALFQMHPQIEVRRGYDASYGFSSSLGGDYAMLVMNVEYNVVHGFERNGDLRGCKVANGTPTISHMLFAVDSYVYLSGPFEQGKAIILLSLLYMFEELKPKKDQWYWLHENLALLIKSSYEWIQENKGDGVCYGIKLKACFWKTKVLEGVALCGKSCEESIMHVRYLAGCSVVFGLDPLFLGQVAAATFGDWLQEVLSRGHVGLFEEALMTSWSIWKARNDLLWNKKAQVAADVVFSARTVLNHWNYARSNRFEPLPALVTTLCTSEHWIAPEMNWVKVNVDGATLHLRSMALVVR
uniref:DUF4283 domain-containing protein n=1 Tax=Cannabis sativa TaxID=3483 RepID=A0A803NYV8_CANSA